ncbi:MAG: cupin domain-containing protein [Anaerolineales bacterium]|nr:cupin domain-containing protein [Anaerolineales bacterium]
MPELKVDQIIQLLQLEPLTGEGGLFRQSYRSSDSLPAAGLPARYSHPKPAGTAIYYLLTDDIDSFSALHRLPTDEIYHFYLGDPVLLTLLLPDGDSRQVLLGQDLLAGQHVQYVVPAGVWQGSRLLPGGAFALLGTTMAPGYTDEDYQAGNQAALLRAYPGQAEVIYQLTRVEKKDGGIQPNSPV